MATAGSPFASSFDAPQHSDVLLVVHTEAVNKKIKKGNGKSPKSASTQGPVARSYHCHALVLSVLSGFFKAQLSSEWQATGSGDNSAAAGSKRAVDIHVESEELDALHELLKMMYSQALPTPALAVPLSLQCLRLADRFEAVSCMELLVGGLAAAPSEAIDYTMLKEVFQASPGVCVSRSYPALLETCSKALVQLLGDAPAVISDEGLLLQFCALPFAAVLAWAKSDDLQVHSENCVVFLLSAWVKVNQNNRGGTAAQQDELAHLIRVFHLGPAYLHHVLPSLAWFRSCSSIRYLPAVLSCIRAGIKMDQGLEAEEGKVCGRSSFVLPPGWCAKPRKASSSLKTCAWVLSPSQLKEADEGKLLALTSPLSVNGFLMRLQVQQAATPSSAPAPGKTLGLYLGVDVAAMAQRGLPLPDSLLVQLGAPHVKAGSPSSEESKDAVIFPAALHEAASLWGSTNFLDAAAPTLLELLAPYLDAGQLHIQGVFSAVDV